MERSEVHAWYVMHIFLLAMTALSLFGDQYWFSTDSGVWGIGLFFLAATFVSWLFRITYLSGQENGFRR
jgi:type IV secretory pathway VirB2 component (pilin)